MRLERSRSRLSFRRRRRRSGGCFTILISIGLVSVVGVMVWFWINRFTAPAPTGGSVNLMASAQNAFARGDLNGAISLTNQILSDEPDNTDALRLLARSLIYRSYSEYDRASDQQTALDATTAAYQREPTNLDVLAIHAFALQADDDANAAADVAQKVLAKNPNYGLAHTALALAYGEAGAHDAALRESQRAVQTSTDDTRIDALRALAITDSDAGSYSDAINIVNQAIALNGNLLTLYFERAQYDQLLGDTDSATVAYFDVLTRDDSNVKARLRLCELSSLLRERDQAIQYCQAVTQRAPSWSEGWYQLGMEYFLEGDFKNAQDDLHRCSTLQVLQNVPVADRRFECWYIQGQAAQIRGDCVDLLATYNEFLSMNLDDQIKQRWTFPPEGPPGCPLAQPTLFTTTNP
ncbi:MAG TPA: hypothetical protein VHD90_02540 [Phototrophicaceae bacterium]|nr:hypothetical protein [Phototrophicaceae bacterium]